MSKSTIRFQKMPIVMCCLLALLLNAGVGDCLTSTSGTMQGAIDEIMAILKDSRLKLPENRPYRRQLILTVVRHHFDFEEMSKLALGIHWREITEEEKKHFVEIFSQLIENS